MLYVYAIADTTPEKPGIGLHGCSLRAFEEAGLVALASRHERTPEPGIEELWRHEQVVERVMEQATVLPLRFGATVADDDELRDFLRSRGEEFRALLGEVRGAVELSVRVAPAASVAAKPAAGGGPGERKSGSEYMRERGEELRAREEAQARVHEPLEAIARRSRLAPGRSGGFTAAYLVERGRVDAFAALVDRLAEESPAPVSCTGPWPPYSFVSEAAR